MTFWKSIGAFVFLSGFVSGYAAMATAGTKVDVAVQNALSARAAAVAAGALDMAGPRAKLSDVDRDLKFLMADGSLYADDFAYVQMRYIEIENEAIEEHHLGRIRESIEAAEQAGVIGEQDLESARRELRRAEVWIQTRPHTEAFFAEAVRAASESVRRFGHGPQK